MCGVLAIVRPLRDRPSVTDAEAIRIRDTMAHRGPDGSGLWRTDNALLAHRRLAILDPTPAGHQPMTTADGRLALVYNGELYNDRELRAELDTLGVRFTTTCDTETVLHAIKQWGPAALPKLRGMFALAAIDVDRRTLLIARDPLGIKPLYWTRLRPPSGSTDELIIASEPRAILAHPAARKAPDLATISAYLTTIRLTLDDRTLFEGLRTVRPGEWIEWDLSRDELPSRRGSTWPVRPCHTRHDVDSVRAAIEASVDVHLRCDVPWCALLSGGLDSTIIAALVACRRLTLNTYCSGHPAADPSADDDFAHARRAAAAIGSMHIEAPVTRDLFNARWHDIIARQWLPLSTPNEVAINHVARTLRSQGHAMTLSGEGADELFAGYGVALAQSLAFERSTPNATAQQRATHQLTANAWVPPVAKPMVLLPRVWSAIESDAALHEWYEDALAETDAPHATDTDPALRGLQHHLRFQRRINLAGLLARLDTATMLESVEGRTPYADAHLAYLAESLPMAMKCDLAELTHSTQPTHQTTAKPATKMILRRAFAHLVPPEILTRPKASFPLPFQSWVADHAPLLSNSEHLREWMNPEVIDAVAANPSNAWSLAWPMMNLASWANAVWPGGK